MATLDAQSFLGTLRRGTEDPLAHLSPFNCPDAQPVCRDDACRMRVASATGSAHSCGVSNSLQASPGSSNVNSNSLIPHNLQTRTADHDLEPHSNVGVQDPSADPGMPPCSRFTPMANTVLHMCALTLPLPRHTHSRHRSNRRAVSYAWVYRNLIFFVHGSTG